MNKFEEISNCFNAIKHNIITCNELDKDLFAFRDYNDWLAVYKKRSVAVREIYKKNTEMVNVINSYLNKDLDSQEYDALYMGYRTLEDRDLHDSYFIIRIIDKLIPYYENIKDYN